MPLEQSWMQILVLFLNLFALVLCLALVYRYIGRVQSSAMQQRVIFDAVRKLRFEQLQNEEAEFYAGDDPDHLLEELRSSKERQKELTSLKHALSSKTQRDEYEEEELSDAETELREIDGRIEFRLSDDRIQQARESKRANDEREKELERKWRQEAQQYANDIVPRSMTITGMGITGAFFIELTAIITIIFGIIILGIFGILGTDEIAPILAAIAGYVLGKTAGAQGRREPGRLDDT